MALAIAVTATSALDLDNTISNRAIGDSCSAPEGKGSCQNTSNCKGISYPQNLCPRDPGDVQCCVEIACSVPQGHGYCRSKAHNGCDGNFVAGSGPPYPCPGSDDIQCCVPGSNIGNLPGLDTTQSAHARQIFSVGKSKGFPIKGCEIAIATALVESNIHVYANSAVPASKYCPYDPGFIGHDYDSVGIFQQRVSIYGGGDVCKPMDPITSSGYFFDALNRVSGWQSMSIGNAAQAVQHSAYPYRYQEQAAAATNICAGGY